MHWADMRTYLSGRRARQKRECKSRVPTVDIIGYTVAAHAPPSSVGLEFLDWHWERAERPLARRDYSNSCFSSGEIRHCTPSSCTLSSVLVEAGAGNSTIMNEPE